MKEKETEHRKRIGAELRGIREEQGWSQAQVALMAGVKEQTVQKVEEGAFNVPLDVLATISNVLGYNLALEPRKEGSL